MIDEHAVNGIGTGIGMDAVSALCASMGRPQLVFRSMCMMLVPRTVDMPSLFFAIRSVAVVLRHGDLTRVPMSPDFIPSDAHPRRAINRHDSLSVH